MGLSDFLYLDFMLLIALVSLAVFVTFQQMAIDRRDFLFLLFSSCRNINPSSNEFVDGIVKVKLISGTGDNSKVDWKDLDKFALNYGKSTIALRRMDNKES